MDFAEVVISILLAVVAGLLGRVIASQNSLKKEVRDLHDWHKPEQGRQEWKNPEIKEAIDNLTDEVRGMREDFRLLAAHLKSAAKAG